jgi:hypothetical protein
VSAATTGIHREIALQPLIADRRSVIDLAEFVCSPAEFARVARYMRGAVRRKNSWKP